MENYISLKKSFIFLFLSFFLISAGNSQPLKINADTAQTRTLFIYGGDVNRVFLRYLISLTNKPNPKICFLPSATGDNESYINYWFELCIDESVRPYVQKVFINSSPYQKSFEERLLDMDAIVVGGGNTLNMLAIWKAQGIDTVLQKAYEKGIILSGGSAGSLCWFAHGFSDSKPKTLTRIEGLNFINASHSPHYSSEPERKDRYERAILAGEMLPGYACDDYAGIVFENERVKKAVSIDSNNKSYFISVKDRKIMVDPLPSELLPAIKR